MVKNIIKDRSFLLYLGPGLDILTNPDKLPLCSSRNYRAINCELTWTRISFVIEKWNELIVE